MAGSQRFAVRVGDDEHEVEVIPGEGGYAISVDGAALRVRPGPDGSWLVDDGNGARQVWLAGEPRPTEGAVAGTHASLEVRTASEAALASALGRGDRERSSGAVSSPMPGRVVKLLVDEGDAVEPGRAVVIVEAMKMENEVAAAAAGVVSKVEVAAGDTVDAGQLLLEIAPHPDPA